MALELIRTKGLNGDKRLNVFGDLLPDIFQGGYEASVDDLNEGQRAAYRALVEHRLSERLHELLQDGELGVRRIELVTKNYRERGSYGIKGRHKLAIGIRAETSEYHRVDKAVNGILTEVLRERNLGGNSWASSRKEKLPRLAV